MSYNDIGCMGTCTNCVPECSRYQITLCIICGEMIQEGEKGCYEHRDVADELHNLREFSKETINKSTNEVWGCGCKPFSSNSMDYCPEHRLRLGSLEQRIYSTTKYLEDLTKQLVNRHYNNKNQDIELL